MDDLPKHMDDLPKHMDDLPKLNQYGCFLLTGHWFRRKDGTKSDSEMQESDDIHYEPQRHFTKVLAQIREKSKIPSRRRSKTTDALQDSSSSGGLDGSPGSQGHLSSSGGSAELWRGRSSTALSATDEENVDLDSGSRPLRFSPSPVLQVSSFGVIPKKGQPGKWRLIVDLSSPAGMSVNDGINPEEFTLQYVRIDEIIAMVYRYGKGALMAKFDVEAAYRNIAVHPSDHYLLGMKWRGKYYVDLVLPFGLRSAPYIFNSVAALVEWILINNYSIPDLVHYLDDFILAGAPGSGQCAHHLQTALAVCKSLGLPLNAKKCEGPATTLVVLGIELDSVMQIARLPMEKLAALRQLIREWTTRRCCNRQQLESLIGHLHHAAKVVWPGRSFLRRMIDLLCCFRKRDHPIRLNREFHLDLQWWHQFLASWHGVNFWLYPGMPQTYDLEVTSDAAGAIGFGAFYKDEWFNGTWADSQKDFSIAYKELFPVVLAAHIWGHNWAKHHVLFRSDNEAVVHILNSRTSRVPNLMRLVRSLLMAAAHSNFTFTSQHIPGLDGIIGPDDKDNFDEVDSQVADCEKIAHAIERLKRKIIKTKEQIRQLQDERDESVKEYLECTERTQNQAKVKTNFEKKNQKTNNTIAQLQRKLQKYHKAMVDLEENGTLSSKVMAKEVLNVVGYVVGVVGYVVGVVGYVVGVVGYVVGVVGYVVGVVGYVVGVVGYVVGVVGYVVGVVGYVVGVVGYVVGVVGYVVDRIGNGMGRIGLTKTNELDQVDRIGNGMGRIGLTKTNELDQVDRIGNGMGRIGLTKTNELDQVDRIGNGMGRIGLTKTNELDQVDRIANGMGRIGLTKTNELDQVDRIGNGMGRIGLTKTNELDQVDRIANGMGRIGLTKTNELDQVDRIGNGMGRIGLTKTNELDQVDRIANGMGGIGLTKTNELDQVDRIGNGMGRIGLTKTNELDQVDRIGNGMGRIGLTKTNELDQVDRIANGMGRIGLTKTNELDQVDRIGNGMGRIGLTKTNELDQVDRIGNGMGRIGLTKTNELDQVDRIANGMGRIGLTKTNELDQVDRIANGMGRIGLTKTNELDQVDRIANGMGRIGLTKTNELDQVDRIGNGMGRIGLTKTNELDQVDRIANGMGGIGLTKTNELDQVDRIGNGMGRIGLTKTNELDQVDRIGNGMGRIGLTKTNELDQVDRIANGMGRIGLTKTNELDQVDRIGNGMGRIGLTKTNELDQVDRIGNGMGRIGLTKTNELDQVDRIANGMGRIGLTKTNELDQVDRIANGMGRIGLTKTNELDQVDRIANGMGRIGLTKTNELDQVDRIGNGMGRIGLTKTNELDQHLHQVIIFAVITNNIAVITNNIAVITNNIAVITNNIAVITNNIAVITNNIAYYQVQVSDSSYLIVWYVLFESPPYLSDDDSSSAASNAPTSLPPQQSSPQHSLPPSPPSVSYDQEINDLRQTQSQLLVNVDSLKGQMELLARSLQEERYKSEHLQCQLSDLTSQWNDMTELHQNEMMSLKIELERAEERMECVEYRLSERAGEIEEALDSYVTRISKVETVQQQNQQMVGALDEYLEQSVQAKALLSKFLSVVLAVLAIVLILFTSIGRLIVPFTRTRPRLLCTSILVVMLLLVWKYQDSDVLMAISALMVRNTELARGTLHSITSPIRRIFFKNQKS
ncbi:hypothetical protein QZH41_009638 [Actinostola sp. cb2023]|nr:hypothetical protein QZH41_009638 [Actinostola sp. cb2023]